jgi:hypothetical protein
MKKYDFEAIKKEMRKIAEEKGIASGSAVWSCIDEKVSNYWDSREAEAKLLLNEYKKILINSTDITYIVNSKTDGRLWLMIHEKGRSHMCTEHEGSRGLWDVLTFLDTDSDHSDFGETMFSDEMAKIGWFDRFETIYRLELK